MFVVIYKDLDGQEDICENEKGIKLFKTIEEAYACIDWLESVGYWSESYRIAKLTFID